MKILKKLKIKKYQKIKIVYLKKYSKITDQNIANIDKISSDKEKRYFKYEQIKPCCLHNGW